jgi:phosphoenolpyruvate-protein kinase (PTS system EI component)
MSDSLSPAVLSLISSTIKGGQLHKKPVGICGAMASDLISVVILIGLGIRELGVVTSLIPDVKAFVRTLDTSLCRQYAQSALLMRGAGEVRDIVKKDFGL